MTEKLQLTPPLPHDGGGGGGGARDENETSE